MPEEKAPLTIRSIQAQNIMRLVSARVQPDNAPVVTLAGDNGSGKSSFLLAIEWLLRGRRALPQDPIRHGAEFAAGSLTLGRPGDEVPALVVERTLTAGREEFTLRGADGSRLRTPQAVLDALLGSRTADPSEFARLDGTKQAEVLRKLAGIDTAALDRLHEVLVETRRVNKHELQNAEAALAKLEPVPEDTPSVEIIVSDLAEELERRLVLEQDASRCLVDLKTGEDVLVETERDRDAALIRVEVARAELTAAEEDLEQNVQAHAAAGAALLVLQGRLDAAQAKRLAERADEIRPQIAAAETTNRAVRLKRARAAAELAVAASRKLVAEAERQVAANRATREKKLREAKYPLPGLGINDAGAVTYNGSRFDQCSSGEQIRVSCAMACALKPGIGVVLMREGAFLDADSRRIVAETAQEYGCQAWIEVVDPNTPGAVVIANGEILEREAPPAELAEELNELDERAAAEADDRARADQAEHDAANDPAGDR